MPGDSVYVDIQKIHAEQDVFLWSHYWFPIVIKLTKHLPNRSRENLPSVF